MRPTLWPTLPCPPPVVPDDGTVNEYTPPAGSIPTHGVPDLSEVRTVHLVGIGGAGMSGLAHLLMARGVTVSGSDVKESHPLTRLRTAGADITMGHHADHVREPDAVVVSSAIPDTNPEVTEARGRGIRVLARGQVLAALMRDRRGVGIVVAGTHGKTSTTSMLAVILEGAGLDPTYLVGGDLNETGNARLGGGDLFLAEADESDGSFLLLEPEIAVLTNVEDDHLNFYPTREDIEAAFVVFCRGAGMVVACADDEGARRVVDAAGVPVLWYGEADDAAVRIEDPVVSSQGSRAILRTVPPAFDRWSGELAIPVPGRQYLANAAGAVAAASRVDVPAAAAVSALAAFRGVRRRWERRGGAQGAEFVDDYAHHPTEIEATLRAARSAEGHRVVAVFQPHRYSRTAQHWRAFGQSLTGADVVVITDVYPGGEQPVPGVTGKLLVDALAEAAPGKRTVYLPRRGDVPSFLAREVRAGDLVLTMGAGDITTVPEETLALLHRGDGHG
jgi:UDP-N-acetylmuramate--alanine ligase